jgi:uncharacterized protein (DUF1684 family)
MAGAYIGHVRINSRTLLLAMFFAGAGDRSLAQAPHVSNAHDKASHRAEIAKFQAGRLAELTADDGWLTVTGLFWLKPGANVAGTAPGSDILLPPGAPAKLGVFTLADGRVTFRADPAAHVTSRGKSVGAEAIDAPTDDPSALAVGDLRMFVIQREDRFGVRLRDLRSAARASFTGLHFYPVRPAYRVTARFVPYNPAKQVAVPNVLGQTPVMTSPGYVTFTLAGRPWRLETVYEDDDEKDLFIIFKDQTSRDTTYPAGRFLHAPLPVNGQVTLDFNKAYNPPCAFTDFATCPLPVRQNQLALRIEAGELAYHAHPAPATAK